VPRAAGQNVGGGRYRRRMSRYRLRPSPAQDAVLLGHCAHARYVWNLCVEQESHWRPGRVEKVCPAYTSQRCSACGHIAAGSRESQALFHCVTCGYASNADVNAAKNIAAGHAVTARGGDGAARPVNREPQPVLLPA
jgi:Putative transposase DNA-binding domain/Helix-turn-helix domain